MRPIDFVTQLGDDYNAPVGAVVEALEQPIIIRGFAREYEVLSYYFDEDSGRMVLDILDIEETT